MHTFGDLDLGKPKSRSKGVIGDFSEENLGGELAAPIYDYALGCFS